MKILKIFLISLVGLIFLFIVGIVIFLKTFDVNRYKPQILSQANSALNRQVNFDKASLGISLIRGINLKVTNFVIAEDPAFGKKEFLAIKDASFTVDALGYILKKKVNVPNILIDSCRVAIIRKKDGSVNVLSIAKPAQRQDSDKKQSSAQTRTAAPAPLALPALFINSLSLSNATVTYIDQSFEPAVNLVVSDVNVRMTNLSLSEPFPFSAEASVLSNKRNVRFEGKAQMDLTTNQVVISEFKGSSDLSLIVLDKITGAFPMTKGVVLPKSLKGQIGVTVTKLTAGPQGLLDMNADVSVTNGSLQFKEIASPMSDVTMNFKVTKDKILMEKASASLGQGIINCTGEINEYVTKQDFNISADAQNLKIQELIVQDKAPVKVEGIASCTMKIKGQGFTPDALKSTLSGDTDILLQKPILKDMNVLRIVLDKISVIPGLSEKIETNFPDRFKQKLTQKDTALHDIKLPITIANGRFLVKETVVGADEFQFKSSGEAGFDGAFMLEGSFLITQELSIAMVNAVSQLKYLLNETNQIYFPLKVTGNAANVKFHVDAEYITKRLLEEQATKEIFKAIDKALGIKGADQTQQNTPQEEPGKGSTTKDTLGNILKDILK